MCVDAQYLYDGGYYVNVCIEIFPRILKFMSKYRQI